MDLQATGVSARRPIASATGLDLLQRACQLIRTGSGAAALDALAQSDYFIDIAVLCQTGNALRVAAAAAVKLNMLYDIAVHLNGNCA